MGLRVHPGLPLLWRDPTTVQIGTTAARGVVVSGIGPQDRRLLGLLDGSQDSAAIDRQVTRRGWDPARARGLLALLADAGVLVDSRVDHVERGPLAGDAVTWSLVRPDADAGALLAARREREVRIRDGGRVGGQLAVVLAAAGVGRVQVDDDRRVQPADVSPAGAGVADVGRSRRDAAQRAVTRVVGPEPDGGPATTTPRRAQRPDLVVLVGHGVLLPTAAQELMRADQPHLAIVLRERDAVVGPLVVPGSGCCLRCLDLHRADRDPAWPRLATQLAFEAPRACGGAETALSTVVAGFAALQVLDHLDGRPVAGAPGTCADGSGTCADGSGPAAGGAEPAALVRDGTVEVLLPDGTMHRRAWAAHPRCGCSGLPDAWPGPHTAAMMGR